MESSPVINPSTYSMLKENLSEIFPELKAAFLEDSFILLDQIKDNLPEGDASVIANAAHTLKSSAKNMGADQLADYCVQIEETTVNEDQLIVLHEKALHEMNAVQEFLNTYD